MAEIKYASTPKAVHDFLIANRLEYLRLRDKLQDAAKQMGELTAIHEHVEFWKDNQCNRPGCELHKQFQQG